MARRDAVRLHAFLLNNGFGVGVTRYADHDPGEEGTARIVVRTTPERGETSYMIVDTEASGWVLGPELTDA